MKRGRVRPSYRIPLHGHDSPRTGGVVGGIFGGGSGGGSGGGGGTTLGVTDGTTTVAPVTLLDFTSGATVSDLGGFAAAIAVASGGMVPYYIPSGDTFVVPFYSQALFSMTIEVDGILEVDGFLIGVD